MLSKAYHKSYLKARKRWNLPYVDDYQLWIAKNLELHELIEIDNKSTWENSEHNPQNYYDYDPQNKAHAHWSLFGMRDYINEQKQRKAKINELNALLMHPVDLEVVLMA